MKPYGPLLTLSMWACISSADGDLLMSLPGTKYSPGSETSALIAAATPSSCGMGFIPISPSEQKHVRHESPEEDHNSPDNAADQNPCHISSPQSTDG